MLFATPLKMFFFGTLMSPRVVSMVTGIPEEEVILHPASIQNFKRYYAEGCSFPVLVHTNNSDDWVDGVLFDCESEEVKRRLDGYEGSLYRSEEWAVHQAGGTSIMASVYMANWDRLSPDLDKEWTYEEWYNRRFGNAA